ncbi:MAG: glycosyltransferase family 2 protein [Lachnospiraceae bacterium]|jgi:glucosyltransferase|nr:glycosyltransferase family 2 protein [Lachnospiraceae bacterium]
MALLSTIVPCYNEEENILPYYEEFMKNRSFFEKNGLSYELIYVDDGSKDGTLQAIKKLIATDPNVHVLSFSRNFGKEAAMYAGMQMARGDYVCIMDCDLQDPPSLLPELYGYLQQDYDMAATRRATRKGEPPLRSWFAHRFYNLINKYSETEIVDGARDYRLMKRQVVDAILSLTEYNRFSKGIFSWVGFRVKWVDYDNVERAHGKTKWSFWGLFSYAMDGIVAFSSAPLKAASILGFLFCLLAFAMIIFTIVRRLIFGDPTSGWPSLVCIILLVSGVQMLCLGAIGQYLEKTYLEVKNRPIYIIKEKI